MAGRNNENKPHVISPREAKALLVELGEYFSPGTAGEHVDGKHRAEVVAKTMELNGKFDEADSLMSIHNAMKEFGNGKAKALAWFSEVPVHENLANDVKNSQFEKSVAPITNIVENIAKILDYSEIDWDKSADVIAKVKRDRFPDKLTMVEKLTNWQHDQSPKGRTKT